MLQFLNLAVPSALLSLCQSGWWIWLAILGVLSVLALASIYNRFSRKHVQETQSNDCNARKPKKKNKKDASRQYQSNCKTPAVEKDNTELKTPCPPPIITEQLSYHPCMQPYDAFLVLDVEATCVSGSDFNYPNEIIEWPVCLMRWKDQTEDKMASQLEIVAEFRSFVKPTWKPQLSYFCTELTGISQAQVNGAPEFPSVLKAFRRFLAKHGLIDSGNGRHLMRFCWVTDGPFDLRDFLVKQAHISKIPIPDYIREVIDLRMAVSGWINTTSPSPFSSSDKCFSIPRAHGKRFSLNISAQLEVLKLPPFTGRQHSGIDDARNIARILADLGRRGITLRPNMSLTPYRRWYWMGKKPGQILDEHCASSNSSTPVSASPRSGTSPTFSRGRRK